MRRGAEADEPGGHRECRLQACALASHFGAQRLDSSPRCQARESIEASGPEGECQRPRRREVEAVDLEVERKLRDGLAGPAAGDARRRGSPAGTRLRAQAVDAEGPGLAFPAQLDLARERAVAGMRGQRRRGALHHLLRDRGIADLVVGRQLEPRFGDAHGLDVRHVARGQLEIDVLQLEVQAHTRQPAGPQREHAPHVAAPAQRHSGARRQKTPQPGEPQ